MNEQELREQIASQIQNMEIPFFHVHSPEAQMLAVQVRQQAVKIAKGTYESE